MRGYIIAEDIGSVVNIMATEDDHFEIWRRQSHERRAGLEDLYHDRAAKHQQWVPAAMFPKSAMLPVRRQSMKEVRTCPCQLLSSCVIACCTRLRRGSSSTCTSAAAVRCSRIPVTSILVQPQRNTSLIGDVATRRHVSRACKLPLTFPTHLKL